MRARVSFLVTFIPKFLHALISQDEIPILVDRHGVRYRHSRLKGP